MKEESLIDQLQPALGADIEMDRFILSQRYMGSFQLRLKRPSRLPAYSRQYIKGDPVHLIDWKAYARSDQLIIREERDEASSKVLIIVDCSDTMFWPEQKSGSQVCMKWELSMRQALHLLFFHTRKGDRAQLLIWNEGDLEPRNLLNVASSQDVLSLFLEFQKQRFDKKTILEHCVEMDVRPELFHLTYLVSDLLRQQVNPWRKKDFNLLRVFHTLSSLELDVNWVDKGFCYYDESRGRKEFLGSTLGETDTYDRVLNKWISKMKKKYSEDHCDYHLFTDKTSIQQYLLGLTTPITGR